MNEIIDPEKEAYFRSGLRLADAYHDMSVACEKGAEVGLRHTLFKGTVLSGLETARGWENLALENRKRHNGSPAKIKASEDNIRKLEEKIKKYEKILPRGNTTRNT